MKISGKLPFEIKGLRVAREISPKNLSKGVDPRVDLGRFLPAARKQRRERRESIAAPEETPQGPIGFLVPSNEDLLQAWPGRMAGGSNQERCITFDEQVARQDRPGEEEKAKLCAACPRGARRWEESSD